MEGTEWFNDDPLRDRVGWLLLHERKCGPVGKCEGGGCVQMADVSGSAGTETYLSLSTITSNSFFFSFFSSSLSLSFFHGENN